MKRREVFLSAFSICPNLTQQPQVPSGTSDETLLLHFFAPVLLSRPVLIDAGKSPRGDRKHANLASSQMSRALIHGSVCVQQADVQADAPPKHARNPAMRLSPRFSVRFQ